VNVTGQAGPAAEDRGGQEGSMYFFSDEERKYLLRGLVPRARQAGVAEELRGWNWHQPPVEPVYDVRLGLWEVAGKYCPTGRDLYLRRVQGVRRPPNLAMVAGGLFHAVLVAVITRAKRLLYTEGVEGYRRALEHLRSPEELARIVAEHVAGLEPARAADLEAQAGALWQFETDRIAARVQEVLSRHPYLNEDALVFRAIPVVVEQKLDGTFLGLSPNLSADAFMASEPVVIDLKFGEPERFHRLTTAGYGMVMEAVYDYPVNVGCIVYARYRDGRWTVRKDLHLIDDELRQWFLEERDEKMRMVFEELDPAVADECPQTCPYFSECRPG